MYLTNCRQMTCGINGQISLRSCINKEGDAIATASNQNPNESLNE